MASAGCWADDVAGCPAATGAPGWLWLVLGAWAVLLVWRWVR